MCLSSEAPITRVGRAEALRVFALEAPLNVVVVDLDMRFIAASPEFLAELGRTMDQVVGLKITDVLPGARAGLRELAEALARGEARHCVTRRVRLPDGRSNWFETQATYWRNDDGGVGGYMMINQEVTVEREAEASRHEMEVLLRAVIDNIPGTLTVQDPATEKFVLVNAFTAGVLGATPEELVGKRVADVASAEQAMAVAEQIASLRASGGFSVAEHSTNTAVLGGRTLNLKRLLFDDGSGRERILSIGEDVTELREANRALEMAVAAAEAANAAKSRFLANISHEIRTPLNGVLGMVQTMARDALPDAQRERLEVVRQSSETLLSLLNDLLDLSKVEEGRIELEVLDFDLGEMIRTACAPFRVMAKEKGVDLSISLADGPRLRRGDPTRVRQVLVNLVSNAVKFTERGHIEVAVSQAGDEVSIAVSDTGPGMSPGTIETIFDKFTQADVSTTRRFGGTGLGLAICRELVELMDGRIEVSSELGVGSRFTFSLALPCAEAPEVMSGLQPPAPVRNIPCVRLLAAEDNPVNQLVLSTLLGQAGLNLTIVGDGAEALVAWAGQDWDVILMDVQMPVMDGVSATAAIRAREASEGRTRTPIIALTADAMAHHIDDYRAAGMDAVVSKPIRFEELLQALDAVLADASAGAVNRPSAKVHKSARS